MEQTDDPWFRLEGLNLPVLAAAVGGFAYIACTVWQQDAAHAAWPAQHAVWTGIIVFAVALIAGRVWLFMRRLEST